MGWGGEWEMAGTCKGGYFSGKEKEKLNIHTRSHTHQAKPHKFNFPEKLKQREVQSRDGMG